MGDRGTRTLLCCTHPECDASGIILFLMHQEKESSIWGEFGLLDWGGFFGILLRVTAVFTDLEVCSEIICYYISSQEFLNVCYHLGNWGLLNGDKIPFRYKSFKNWVSLF